MKVSVWYVIAIACYLMIIVAAGVDANKPSVSHQKQHEEVECEQLLSRNIMVAVVLGQSNAANYGQGRYVTKENVYVFHEKRCFKFLRDPLLGATGTGGSVWSRLGDLVIKKGYYDNVMFVPMARGGSRIRRWGGHKAKFRKPLRRMLLSVKKAGFKITHILWHQGEAESLKNTTKEYYKEKFLYMVSDIRKVETEAPIYISVATHCGKYESQEIRNAQKELVNIEKKLLPGPNTDTLIGPAYRRSGDCHFSREGLLEFAYLWMGALFNYKKSPSDITY